MHWLEIAAIVLGLLGFFAMGALLAYRLYQNPLLLAGLAPVLWAHLKPVFIKHVLPLFGRMSEEDEREMRQWERAGRGDEWLRERWHRRKRKGRVSPP